MHVSLLSPVATVTFNEAEETVSLEFPSQLATGEVTLALQYTGKLNDQMRGFYRSKYTDPNSPGTEKYAATTQFEVLCVMSGLPIAISGGQFASASCPPWAGK